MKNKEIQKLLCVGLVCFLLGLTGGNLLPNKPMALNDSKTKNKPDAKLNNSTKVKPPNSDQALAGTEEKVGESPYSGAIGDVAAQFPELFKRIRDVHDETLFSALLDELAKTDPAYAVSLFESLPPGANRETLMSSLIRNWGVQDPIAAFKWLETKKGTIGEDHYGYLAMNALTIMARIDPNNAAKYLHHAADREMVLANMAEGWMKQGPEKAFTWLESLSEMDGISSMTIKSCYSMVMQQYMAINPTEAALAITDLDSLDLKKDLIGPMVNTLAMKDMEQATDWLQSFKNKELQRMGLMSLVSEYGINRPDVALDYFIANPEILNSEDDIPLLTTSVETAAMVDPYLIFDRLESFPAEMQPNIIESTMTSWCNNDLHQAQSWLSAQPAGPAFDAGAGAIAQSYMWTDSTKAFPWGMKINEPELRGTILGNVIECADEKQIPDVQQLLEAANLSEEERARFQGILDKRLNNMYSKMVLPSN